MSNGLRTELAKDGILVTTIVPSLVRTGSARNALFKGQHRKEHAWFSIAASLPGVAMSAERAAAQILRASRDGERGPAARPGESRGGLAIPIPGLHAIAAGVIARLLPRMGGIGERSAYGYESASRWSPSLLTRSGDGRAAQQRDAPSPGATLGT